MMIGNIDTAPVMQIRVTKLMVSEEIWSGADLFLSQIKNLILLIPKFDIRAHTKPQLYPDKSSPNILILYV